jgi:hypothetical protein
VDVAAEAEDSEAVAVEAVVADSAAEADSATEAEAEAEVLTKVFKLKINPIQGGFGGRGGGRGRGGPGGRGGRGGGMKVIVEPHRHGGVFIAKGKEDVLVTKNLVPGNTVYGEKKIEVRV